MIRSSMMKTKVMRITLVEDKDQNNECSINTRNGDKNDMDNALVKEKDQTRPSEATEEIKRKTSAEESEKRSNLKDDLQYHNFVSILILTRLKITL